MGQKGSNTTTTTQAPSPQAMLAYQQLLGGAMGTVNNNPFQTYGGEFVAGVNPQQYGGISNINTFAESAQPTITQAEQLAMQGATPISAGDIQNYYSPYQQNVISATEAQFNQQNAVQQQQLLANAAAQGALGGDRVGVAQAALAGQQNLTEAPAIAGLEQQGFQQAAQLALAAKQQQAQGAYSLGNLGVAGQQAGLTGAGAQVQAGTLEQQTQQQLDAARYNEFLMQQAFPYQRMQWLAGIDTGVGSQMGGTSQTTGPPPSLLAQLGGLGLAGVGVLGGTGGFGPSGYLKTMFSARGGRVEDNGPLEAHQADDGVYHVAIQPTDVRWGSGAHPPTGEGAQAQQRGKFLAQQAGFGFEERGKGFDGGGGVPALIGQPLYGGVSGFIPQAQLTRGRGAPPPPSAAPSSATQMIADAQKMASAFKGPGSRNNAPSGPLDLSAPPPGEIEPPQDLTGGMDPIRARGGIVDRLPRHDRIDVPRRGGFGLGSFLPVHRQEGGPTILPDGTIDHGTVYLDPEDVPGQGATPQALREQEGERAIAAALARSETAGPPQQGGFASAMPFAGEGAPVAGMSATPVADRIAARYGQGRAPVSVQPGVGESAPWSSSQSNIWPALMAAGFGMMGSRSPFAGVAIGEGGLRGLQTYQQLGQEQRAEAMSQQKINQAADNLALHAEQVQKNLALQTREFEEPKGYRKTAEGLRYIPGGPADPEVIRAAAEAKGEMWAPMLTPEGNYVLMNKRTAEVKTPQGLMVPQPAQPQPSAAPAAVPANTSEPGNVPSSPLNASAGNTPPVRVASADPNIVGIVRANAAQAAQPYNYGRDAPYIEKGMEVPEPVGISGKSVQTIKTDAEYFLQTGKLPPVARGNSPVAVQQNNYRNAVQNYGNALAASRGVTPEQTAEAWRTAPGMLRFVLGPDGRSTVALGTAVRHLDTLKQLADAWAANDIQTLNRLRAVVSREFGNEAATNLQAAGRIIGPEIIKAIGVAGAGTAEERIGAQNAFSTAVSPAQMAGAIDTTQKLLGGQLEGRQRQAANAGVSPERFKSLIGDRPYEILTHIDRGGAGAAAPTPTAADIAYARAHPEVRDKFRARFGREP